MREPLENIIIRINKRFQKPSEPFCGPITYCAISGNPTSRVEEYHKKAKMRPSVGFFYLSFHKLDDRAVSYVERSGNLLDPKDKKCFDVMWKFEEPFQKIAKKRFIEEVIKNARGIYEKYRENIHISDRLKNSDYRRIIQESLEERKPVAALVMQDINQYLGKKPRFDIPHWVTVHGFRDGRYLLYNSYETRSKWVPEKELFGRIDSVRKYGFSPQLTQA